MANIIDPNVPNEASPEKKEVSGVGLAGGGGTKVGLGGGPGRPLFTAYVYPFEPPETGVAGTPGGKAGVGGGPGRPLFRADIYPYSPPDEESKK